MKVKSVDKVEMVFSMFYCNKVERVWEKQLSSIKSCNEYLESIIFIVHDEFVAHQIHTHKNGPE